MNKYAELSLWWIAVLVMYAITIIICVSGCQAHAVSTTIDKIPASGWESTMNAIAKTNWFGTFCLLNFFGGVVAIGLDQRKIGGAIVIAAITTICLGLAIHRFPTWLAIIGFASSVIAVGYSILIKNKALVEIIRGIQFAKGDFGRQWSDRTKAINKSQEANQSKSTKKIVKQVKEKI